MSYFQRLVIIGALSVCLAVAPAHGDDKSDAIALIKASETSFRNFLQDPNMAWFRDGLKHAEALVIVPQLWKGGFIFGASGGNAVVLAKDKATDSWSYPAFYTIGSITWGLQAGGEVAEVVMLVMTESGMHSLLSTKFQLGGDASIATGPEGAGAQAATVDILQFTRTQGIFGGLTLEGAVITPRNDLIRGFYGNVDDPVDVLIRMRAANPIANPLRESVFASASPAAR